PDLQAGSDTGASDTDNRTGAATRVFDVAATESGSTVVLLRNGAPVAGVGGSTTGTGAAVTLTDANPIADGLYHYSVRQTDVAGNVATSADLDVTFDTTAPLV